MGVKPDGGTAQYKPENVFEDVGFEQSLIEAVTANARFYGDCKKEMASLEGALDILPCGLDDVLTVDKFLGLLG